MSKVMLILDNPKKCEDCILLNDRCICVATNCNTIGMEADLCPLEDVSTIEEMLIVRCKDCKHFIKYENWEYGHCELVTPTIAMDKEWFCPNGERKQDE